MTARCCWGNHVSAWRGHKFWGCLLNPRGLWFFWNQTADGQQLLWHCFEPWTKTRAAWRCPGFVEGRISQWTNSPSVFNADVCPASLPFLMNPEETNGGCGFVFHESAAFLGAPLAGITDAAAVTFCRHYIIYLSSWHPSPVVTASQPCWHPCCHPTAAAHSEHNNRSGSLWGGGGGLKQTLSLVSHSDSSLQTPFLEEEGLCQALKVRLR